MLQQTSRTRNFALRAAGAVLATGVATAGLIAAPAARAAQSSDTFTCTGMAGQQTSEATFDMDVTEVTQAGPRLRIDTWPVQFGYLYALPQAGLRVTYTFDVTGSPGQQVTASTYVNTDVGTQPLDLPASNATLNLPASAPDTDVQLRLRGLDLNLEGTTFLVPCTTRDGSIAVTYRTPSPPPSLGVSPVKVEPGDTVQVTGSGWPDGTPEFCLGDGGGGCITDAFGSRTYGVRDGVLSASLELRPDAPTGQHVLTVNIGTSTASTPLEIALPPEPPMGVTVTPPAGPVGTEVTFRGQGFPSRIAVHISTWTSHGALPGRLDLTTAADGSFTASTWVTDPATTSFEVGMMGMPLYWLPWTVVDPGEGQSASENVDATFQPGTLWMSHDTVGISFGTTTLNGTARQSTAELTPVTVVDARGGTLGWTVNASLTALVSADGKGRIPAANVSWIPTCTASADSGALPGSPNTLGTTTTLCAQAPSENPTGGEFTAGAELTLTGPRFLPAGTYSGTLTLTLT